MRDKLYWQYANGTIEGWADTEDGKCWYRFSDIPHLYSWARQHRFHLVEVA